MYVSVTLSETSIFFGNTVTNEKVRYDFYEYGGCALQKDFKWYAITKRKLMTGGHMCTSAQANETKTR